MNPITPEAMKHAASAAMRAGIQILPICQRFRFVERDCDAVANARYLGALTYEEIEAARVPLLHLNASAWSGDDACYLLHDEGRVQLVALHRYADGSGMRVSVFAGLPDQPTVILPMDLMPDCTLQPTITVVIPGGSAFATLYNITRCALNGASIVLDRHRRAAGRG